jgi:alpha-aminoadipic semialdehyde synthase
VHGKKNSILQGATICQDGQLAMEHRHLESKVTGSITVSKRPSVLLLGSGRVAAPLVDYFLRDANTFMTIGTLITFERCVMAASNNLTDAKTLAKNRPNARCISLDVSDTAATTRAIQDADIVISLLPAPMHPPVARICVDLGKHMVTTSYISPDIASLHASYHPSLLLIIAGPRNGVW